MSTSESAFHADDTEQVVDYHTISPLAIVGLLFGLASPLCLAWPLLTTVPLVGAVISIVALRRIDSSDGALVGRWPATIGLVLCVASGAAALSNDFVARYIRSRQAEELAKSWFSLLLAGDTEQAFKLSVAGNRREPPPEPGMPPPEPPYEIFVKDPVVSMLVVTGADAEIGPAETLMYEVQPRRQFMIQQKYTIMPKGGAEDSHVHPIDVLLTLQRSQLLGEPRPRWLVRSYESPHATGEAGHVH